MNITELRDLTRVSRIDKDVIGVGLLEEVRRYIEYKASKGGYKAVVSRLEDTEMYHAVQYWYNIRQLVNEGYSVVHVDDKYIISWEYCV